ncbi:MAG: tetratricopeptide repeat protein [Tepidisphaeraceae bacterium]|jgi:predicted O-linked N-acetylglucosamine transferase (SPINDLY family)
MPDHAVQQNLQAALAQYRAGNPLAAEKLCRRVLSLQPENVDALNLLGACFYLAGNLKEAIEVYQRIAALKPDLPEAHNNLGGCLQRNGRLAEAVAAFKTAIKLKGDFPVAKSNLAAACFEWGNALSAKGQTAEALEAFQQAVALKPDFIEGLEKIGQCLQSLEKIDEAIAAFQTIIRLNPGSFEAFNNLGIAFKDRRQFNAAIASFRQAIGLKPDLAEAHNNLGNALKEVGQLDEAIAALRQAIRLKPDFADAHNNLGLALTDIGHGDAAITFLRQAIRLKPDYAVAHSNLIYTLHFHPGYDARMIHEELRRWNQQHAEPLKKFIQPHTNNRDPDRRLRIGYLSPDFREHVVGQNLLPMLRQHDHGQVEIFCYANVLRPDARTDELRRHADVWRSIAGMSDSQAAELIRQDGIDILVDLTLHTAENRLGVFARKPAPVQVAYLGSCTSTGMETMDYRLSDPYLDPSDSDSSVYSERTIRLPETYWCYRSTGPTPEPSPSPVAAAGYVTFGCLNNFAKVSPPALDLWAQILQGVPRSRLILHSNPGAHLDALRERFAGKGVSPDRLEFYLERGNWPKYLQTYGRIDIALDPFPWGGGITTCDALWMGVPVVSLAGRTAVGRGGASILANVGVPELVARTPQQYVQIAAELAGDLPRLAELRRTLRARMQASPLMDAPRFARNIEAAYRQMWRNWCQQDGIRPSANRPLQSGP